MLFFDEYLIIQMNIQDQSDSSESTKSSKIKTKSEYSFQIIIMNQLK